MSRGSPAPDFLSRLEQLAVKQPGHTAPLPFSYLSMGDNNNNSNGVQNNSTQMLMNSSFHHRNSPQQQQTNNDNRLVVFVCFNPFLGIKLFNLAGSELVLPPPQQCQYWVRRGTYLLFSRVTPGPFFPS